MIRLLIVDDQAPVRQGLASLLALEEDFEIAGQAGNGQEACFLAEDLRPDLILMDIRMPGSDGVMAMRKIHERFPQVKILALTTFSDEDYVLQALAAGASGYLLKDTPSAELAAAIRCVHQGHTLLSQGVSAQLVSRLSVPAPASCPVDYESLLGAREIEVLKLIGRGRSNKEIALLLHISEGTVKNHITGILKATGARSRTQAALFAREHVLKD